MRLLCSLFSSIFNTTTSLFIISRSHAFHQVALSLFWRDVNFLNLSKLAHRTLSVCPCFINRKNTFAPSTQSSIIEQKYLFSKHNFCANGHRLCNPCFTRQVTMVPFLCHTHHCRAPGKATRRTICKAFFGFTWKSLVSVRQVSDNQTQKTITDH